jgi:hypothetical protein
LPQGIRYAFPQLAQGLVCELGDSGIPAQGLLHAG